MRGLILVLALATSLVPSMAKADVERPSRVPNFLEIDAARSLEHERAGLVARLEALVERLAAHNARCSRVRSDASELVEECRRAQADLASSLARYRAALAEYEERCRTAPRRSYRIIGNGLVGGTTWRTGYYSPLGASPDVQARARAMLRQQARLANVPYDEAIDLDRYNFIIGVAASTSAWTDLRTRVMFDQLANGQYTAETQTGYEMLRGRQFEELGCHSNGAMVCLAALSNQDIRAERVVLYGPQITPESMSLWNHLLESGRISSLDIYINENDPVPPVSLLANRAVAEHAAELRPLLFDVRALTETVQELSPEAVLHTFSCGSSPTLDCHGMSTYTTARECDEAQRATVPGTRVRRQATQAPPGLRCPH